ncbi:hypothetical protein EVAR_37988_1 [Eumeta japonica]|uniref:Uncharacterized protein n=1 Tax=Eumeta variegata TaxID=151549 RepID=A0A4C1ZYV6_EUMVA|nr:hypothetical protein EVAR_37988_1 [Eumeta japonica]
MSSQLVVNQKPHAQYVAKNVMPQTLSPRQSTARTGLARSAQSQAADPETRKTLGGYDQRHAVINARPPPPGPARAPRGLDSTDK